MIHPYLSCQLVDYLTTFFTILPACSFSVLSFELTEFSHDSEFKFHFSYTLIKVFCPLQSVVAVDFIFGKQE